MLDRYGVSAAAIGRTAAFVILLGFLPGLVACGGGAAGDAILDIDGGGDGDGSGGGSSPPPDPVPPTISVDEDFDLMEGESGWIMFSVSDHDDDVETVTFEQLDGPELDYDYTEGNSSITLTFQVPVYEFGNSVMRFRIRAEDSLGQVDSVEITRTILPAFHDMTFNDGSSFVRHYVEADDDNILRLELTATKAAEHLLGVASRTRTGIDMRLYSGGDLDPATLLDEGLPKGAFESAIKLRLEENEVIYAVLETQDGASIDAHFYRLSKYLESGFPADFEDRTGHNISDPDKQAIAVGNVDADADLEIFVGMSEEAGLHAWNADGSELAGWPETATREKVHPSLGNLVGDSDALELVAAASPVSSGCASRAAFAFDNTAITLTGWPPNECRNTLDHVPMLVDVDGDDIDEVFFDGIGFHADATPIDGWDSGNEEPAAADINGDGTMDFVMANFESLKVVDIDRNALAGFPVDLSEPGIFRNPISPPLLADVTGDGEMNIVLLVSAADTDNDLDLYVFDNAGNLEHSFPVIGNFYDGHSPSLADLDGDGDAEILVRSQRAVGAYHGDGSVTTGWPADAPESSDGFMDQIGPLVADVDGDLEPDIVMVAARQIVVFDRHGNVSGLIDIAHPDRMPAIADIDNDGRNEIIVSAPTATMSVNPAPGIWVFDLGGGTHGEIQWGQSRGGPRRQNTWPIH